MNRLPAGATLAASMHWMLEMKLLLLHSAGWLVAAGVAPDVIRSGYKGVRHQLVLEWAEDQRDARFVAWPMAGFTRALPIVSGQPFWFSGKYGTRIYRLDATEAWPDRANLAHPGGMPCRQIRSVPVIHPLAALISSYRVLGVRDGALVFEFLGEQRFDANGNPIGSEDLWPWLLLTALVGGVGLVVIARRGARPPA